MTVRRRDRHRRHVHRRDLIDEETGAVVDREGALDAGRPVARASCTRSSARSPRARWNVAGRLRRPRDDRRDERDHRGQDRAQRLRHDRRLPRPARDRAPGAADALRHAVREAARRSSRATARSGSRERLGPAGEVLAAARRGVGARGGGGAAARGRRVGRRLPAPLLRQPRARAAGRRDPRRGAAGRAGLALVRGRARVPRVPARIDDRDQRGRSGPSSSATSSGSRGGSPRPGVDAKLLVMQSSGGVFSSAAARRAARVHGRVGPGRGRDRLGAPRRDRSGARTSSRSTWAARPPRSG